MSLHRSRRYACKLLDSIKRHSRPGEGPIAASLLERCIDLYLTSTASKAVALSQADPKRAISPDLFERAERLDVMASFRGSVPWRFEPRKSGPPRCVVSLPWELSAAHWLAAELIYAQIEPGAHIFDWRGRGRDRAALTLAHLMQNHGQHVLLADVRQCFASVNIDAIAALNILPLELIRNALDYRQLRFRRYDPPAGVPIGIEDVEQMAPRGLLEGSAASNPLLATFFNDLPSHLDESVAALVISDNIAIVAPSEETCSKAEEDLGRYFAGHLAGPFFLTKERFLPGESCEWLGYAFERRADGTVCIEHSGTNWSKAMRKVFRHPNLRSWGDAEKITAELLNGFPAASQQYRETLFMIVSDELAAVKRGVGG